MYDDETVYGDDDPRLDAWLAFRAGENPPQIIEHCCDCGKLIPEEDDVIELYDNDGSLEGRLCQRCADEG
jgi:hypothetical protein